MPTVIVILCFTLILGWVCIMMRGKMLDEKTTATKNIVDVAYGILVQFDERVNKGEMPLEEGQKKAALEIQNLRYAGNEYFWINDLYPKMIMHPFKPEMNGQDLTENKDPKGKRIFVEFASIGKAKGKVWSSICGRSPARKILSRKSPM